MLEFNDGGCIGSIKCLILLPRIVPASQTSARAIRRRLPAPPNLFSFFDTSSLPLTAGTAELSLEGALGCEKKRS